MGRYFVYMLKSDKDYTYIGQTNNLQDRLQRHKTGRNIYTRNKGNWELKASLEVNTRKEAVALETKLKRMKNFEKALKYLLIVTLRIFTLCGLVFLVP